MRALMVTLDHPLQPVLVYRGCDCDVHYCMMHASMRELHGVPFCTEYYIFVILMIPSAMFLPPCHILASTVVLTLAMFILCRYSGDYRCIWGPGSGREHVDRCICHVYLFGISHPLIHICLCYYFP